MSRRVTRSSRKQQKNTQVPDETEHEFEVSESVVVTTDDKQKNVGEDVGNDDDKDYNRNSPSSSAGINSTSWFDEGEESVRKRKSSKPRKAATPARSTVETRSRSKSQSRQPRTTPIKRKWEVEIDGEEYEVDFILNKRVSVFGENVDYLVKWKNYPEAEATWEPFSHVESCAAVAVFEDALKNDCGIHQLNFTATRSGSDSNPPVNYHRGTQTVAPVESKRRERSVGTILLHEMARCARAVLVMIAAMFFGLPVLTFLYVFLYNEILL